MVLLMLQQRLFAVRGHAGTGGAQGGLGGLRVGRGIPKGAARWIGALRESGHLGRIPNCLEVPPPPGAALMPPVEPPAPPPRSRAYAPCGTPRPPPRSCAYAPYGTPRTPPPQSRAYAPYGTPRPPPPCRRHTSRAPSLPLNSPRPPIRLGV